MPKRVNEYFYIACDQHELCWTYCHLANNYVLKPRNDRGVQPYDAFFKELGELQLKILISGFTEMLERLHEK